MPVNLTEPEVECLRSMRDGKTYFFFEHALAVRLSGLGLIWGRRGSGEYCITDAGRAALGAA